MLHTIFDIHVSRSLYIQLDVCIYASKSNLCRIPETLMSQNFASEAVWKLANFSVNFHRVSGKIS